MLPDAAVVCGVIVAATSRDLVDRSDIFLLLRVEIVEKGLFFLSFSLFFASALRVLLR